MIFGFGPEGFVFDRAAMRHMGDEMRSAMGGGPRGRRMYDGQELRLVLLKLIGEQPRHGYELIRAIEDLSGGSYSPSPGVVYPALTFLTELGLVEEQATEGTRRRFAATEAGRAELADKEREVTALFARLDRLKDASAERSPSPAWRAFGNLATVLRHAAHEGEKGHDIAEMIDDLARRIERMR